MVILDIAELIPSNHLLWEINQMVSLEFVCDLALQMTLHLLTLPQVPYST